MVVRVWSGGGPGVVQWWSGGGLGVVHVWSSGGPGGGPGVVRGWSGWLSCFLLQDVAWASHFLFLEDACLSGL